MSSFLATDSGRVEVDPANLKRDGAPSAQPGAPGSRIPPIRGPKGWDRSGDAAPSNTGESAAKQVVPRLAASGFSTVERHHGTNPENQAGSRAHERRWRDASIFLVERRRGDLWKYGSIALCVALWAYVWLLFRT